MFVDVTTQGRVWPGLLWLRLMVVVFIWTRLNRLVGVARVNGWALNGCYRLCWIRMRVGCGPWSRWQRAYGRSADGLRVYLGAV